MAASHLLCLAACASAFVAPQPRSAPQRTVSVHGYSPTKKRVGDAACLVGLSCYQQALPSVLTAAPLDPVTLDLGGACIRARRCREPRARARSATPPISAGGCRLTVCLFVAEKIFKAFRAPESTWEVPVPGRVSARFDARRKRNRAGPRGGRRCRAHAESRRRVRHLRAPDAPTGDARAFFGRDARRGRRRVPHDHRVADRLHEPLPAAASITGYSGSGPTFPSTESASSGTPGPRR